MIAVAARVRRWRLVAGARLPRGSAPLGVATVAREGEPFADGDALWFSPSAMDPNEPTALAAVLPDPEVTPLIVVGDVAAERGLVARLFGRAVQIPRATRGAALLLRGYRAIGGAVDPKSGLDLCWGER